MQGKALATFACLSLSRHCFAAVLTLQIAGRSLTALSLRSYSPLLEQRTQTLATCQTINDLQLATHYRHADRRGERQRESCLQ